MKRIRMEVCPAIVGGWKALQDGTCLITTDTQAEALLLARVHIDILVGQGRTVTLKIKRPNGQIREERTYPRSSDPRRSKG